MSSELASISGVEPGQMRAARYYRWASLLLFAVVGILALHTLPDYGVSWDEYFRWKGGQQKLFYYQALFAGGDARSVLPAEDFYPGFFDLNVALLNEVLPFGLVALGHGMSLAFGLATVVAVWAIGRMLGGERLGFWCAVFLLMIPRFYGHMFFNPKDIPFAAMMAWSLYFLLRWGRWLPKPRLAATLALGVVVGLTLATRIGGMVVLAYIAGYAGIILLRELMGGGGFSRQWWLGVLRVAIHGLVIGGVALLVLIPWWPMIHDNPLFRIVEAFQVVSKYPWNGMVLFGGDMILASDLPWTYLPVWLGISLPDFLLLTLAGGMVLLFLRWRNAVRALVSPEGLPWVMVTVATAFPLVYILVRHSVVYDGIRHVLFILPPLACLGALAWVKLLDALAVGALLWRRLAVAVMAVLMLIQLGVLYALHPYEYVYFNQLSGGLENKHGRYETEYWATSTKEMLDWLNLNAPEGQTRVMVGRVFSPAAVLFRPERLELVTTATGSDFFMGLTRGGQDAAQDIEPVYVVERFGVPFGVIKDIRGYTPSSPDSEGAGPGASATVEAVPPENATAAKERQAQGQPDTGE